MQIILPFSFNFQEDSSSLLMFLLLAKAKLSGHEEESLSSESDKSDDEYDQSKGRWCFVCFESG